MDNEELKELLENLKNTLAKNSDLDKEIDKGLEKHLKIPCSISVKRTENGEYKTSIEGTNTGVLLTLAGLEKTILEKTNPPVGFWELIKEKVGIKEAEKNG